MMYYRGDNRKWDVIKSIGFQPRYAQFRGRTPKQAYGYILSLLTGMTKPSLFDIVNYIVSSPKGDSVSTSAILDGASYGDIKYKITCPGAPLYFACNKNGTIGAQLPHRPNMYGGGPYYITNHFDFSKSDFLIIASKTCTEECTFFTDIPSGWITPISQQE